MKLTPQAQRILEALTTGRIVPAPELSRIGSGKPDGWCASFTKRISEIRDAGFNVVMVEDHRVDGQRRTAYQIQNGQPVQQDLTS